jgi:hypothetical protein
VHDFPQDASGQAIPYGIYSLNDNCGYVSIEDCFDTPRFAVESINDWWQSMGYRQFPKVKQLPLKGVEGPAARAALRRSRLERHGVPLPDWVLEVESHRAPALQPYQHELGGQTAAQL